MKPLNLADLKPGQFVWLESYGYASQAGRNI